jgi:hypothetical protein
VALQTDSAYQITYYWWAIGSSIPSIGDESPRAGLYMYSKDSVRAMADVKQVSGSASSAAAFRTMLDGTGGNILSLRSLAIRATDADDTAIIAYGGSDAGIGLYADGVYGGYFKARTSSGYYGMRIVGVTSYPGLSISGGASAASDMSLDNTNRFAGFIDSASAVAMGATQRGLMADALWDEDTTGHGTAKSFGLMIKDTSAYQGAANSLTAKDVADSVWQRTFGQADAVAGSIWDSINTAAYVQGAAAGIDSGVVQGAVIAALNADTTMKFKKINLRQAVIGGENNDSASFLVYNNGTTPAMQIEGDGELGDPALLIHSDSGYGLKMMTDNKSLDGLESSIYSGFYASAAGIKGFGGVFANTNEDSNAIATGSGLLIKADGWNHGLTITVGEAGDTVGYTGSIPNNKAINVEGPTVLYGRNDWRRMGSASDDAFTAHGVNMGKGGYFYSDSSIGARFSTANGDTSIIIGGDVYFGTGQGIHGNLEGTVDDIDSSITASVDFAGAGSYAMTVYAVDTSGTDAAVSGVNVEVHDLTGTMMCYLPTNSSGYSRFLVDSGSWVIQATTRNGYVWEYDTVTVVAAAKTDTMQGYNINVGSPTATNLCRVYGYVYDISGDSIQGASVKAVLGGRSVRDTCANVTLATGFAVDTVTTSSGYWCLDLIKSKCLLPATGVSTTTYYNLTITYPDGTIILDRKINVPDSTSYRVTW